MFPLSSNFCTTYFRVYKYIYIFFWRLSYNTFSHPRSPRVLFRLNDLEMSVRYNWYSLHLVVSLKLDRCVALNQPCRHFRSRNGRVLPHSGALMRILGVPTCQNHEARSGNCNACSKKRNKINERKVPKPI